MLAKHIKLLVLMETTQNILQALESHYAHTTPVLRDAFKRAFGGLDMHNSEPKDLNYIYQLSVESSPTDPLFWGGINEAKEMPTLYLIAFLAKQMAIAFDNGIRLPTQIESIQSEFGTRTRTIMLEWIPYLDNLYEDQLTKFHDTCRRYNYPVPTLRE
jgi:hypothetical protein